MLCRLLACTEVLCMGVGFSACPTHQLLQDSKEGDHRDIQTSTLNAKVVKSSIRDVVSSCGRRLLLRPPPRISFLKTQRKELSHDIQTGTLSSKVVKPSIREAVAKVLKSDLELATFITAEYAEDDWGGSPGCDATPSN
ncbi:hypothetical protein QYE76_018407 [Lolium multiflorum]|uniref:Uncharacterized protein n=1 Tax=Lolium multiflorum TaxID=4521 RepID=A0AAD8VD70_LOLMU|nr:hypothetical protein QYE76_018407 [Lolium multiflorum]